jgi:hypothetical protein
MRALAAAVTFAALGSAAVVALGPLPTAGAEPASSRIVDRTLSCAVGARAGVRSVTVHARTGLRDLDDRSKWKQLASLSLRDSYSSFASVAAGNPVADLAPGVPARPERVTMAVAPTCRAAERIPLSAKRLSRASASQLGDTYDCLAGMRVLVRVRGVFRSPTSLRLRRFVYGRTSLVAVGTVRHGYVAVRSAAGKPLAYAEVLESGKARVFTARSCVED